MTVYLLEIPAWNGSSVITLRYATHSKTTGPSDIPANTYYDGRIIDPGSIDRKLFADNATSGRANVDVGFVTLNNRDGALDPLIGYAFNRVATLKELSDRDAPVSGATTVLRMLVQGYETSDGFATLRLRTRGRMAELDKPLLTERYAGTTLTADSTELAEGDETLADQVKPHVYGSAQHVPGRLVNKVLRFWQFAANGCSSLQLYDGGIALQHQGPIGSLAALKTFMLDGLCPRGWFVSCPSEGIAATGGDTSFVVTADVVEGATASVRSAARIAQRLLALVPSIGGSDIVTATFDAFHAFNGAEINIVIDDDRSAIDAITAVVDSVGGGVLDTAAGQFEAIWLTEPSTTVDASYTIRDVLEGNSLQVFAGPKNEGQGTPAYSVVLNWGRIWKQFSTGDLARVIGEATGGADLALKQLLTNPTGYRQVESHDSAVQTAYPEAVQLTFDTLLTSQSAAAAEAARRLALHKVRRDRFVFPTFFADGDVELGRSVRVTLNRFGLDGGKNFVVLGRKDDFKARRRVPVLWG